MSGLCKQLSFDISSRMLVYLYKRALIRSIRLFSVELRLTTSLTAGVIPSHLAGSPQLRFQTTSIFFLATSPLSAVLIAALVHLEALVGTISNYCHFLLFFSFKYAKHCLVRVAGVRGPGK